ncbi:unnamed protein product [Arctogadus glacialis]
MCIPDKLHTSGPLLPVWGQEQAGAGMRGGSGSALGCLGLGCVGSAPPLQLTGWNFVREVRSKASHHGQLHCSTSKMLVKLNGGGGDDLGANDEMISFKDEGEPEEKISENSSAERDLADVKSSLVNESETHQNSSSDSEAERRPPPRSETFRDKTRESLEEAAKRQDGGLFKSPPYPGYPFIMIPDLTSTYLPNGSLSPTARTSLL